MWSPVILILMFLIFCRIVTEVVYNGVTNDNVFGLLVWYVIMFVMWMRLVFCRIRIRLPQFDEHIFMGDIDNLQTAVIFWGLVALLFSITIFGLKRALLVEALNM